MVAEGRRSLVVGALALAACTSGTPLPLPPTNCLAGAQESCVGYAEGTQCPALQRACVACSTDGYTLAPDTCTCTSGVWNCEPPAASVACTPAAPRYADRACTESIAVDAGADAASKRCEGPFTTQACATPAAIAGSCPSSLADLPAGNWCSTARQSVAQWTRACDGLVAVSVVGTVNDAGNCSTVYFFDVASRVLVGVGAECNGEDVSCRAGSPRFAIPGDCFDGGGPPPAADICATLDTDGGASAPDSGIPTADSCVPSCDGGAPCVRALATGDRRCAGPACGDSARSTAGADASACAAGQTCEAVQYDPCPSAGADASPCSAAPVTFEACLDVETDRDADAATPQDDGEAAP